MRNGDQRQIAQLLQPGSSVDPLPRSVLKGLEIMHGTSASCRQQPNMSHATKLTARLVTACSFSQRYDSVSDLHAHGGKWAVWNSGSTAGLKLLPSWRRRCTIIVCLLQECAFQGRVASYHFLWALNQKLASQVPTFVHRGIPLSDSKCTAWALRQKYSLQVRWQATFQMDIISSQSLAHQHPKC